MALEFPDKARELLEVINSNYQESISLHSEQQRKIDVWRDAYKMKPYGHEQKGKTSIVIPTVKKYLDWQGPALKAPFLDTLKILKTNAVVNSPDTIKLAKMYENFINFTWRKRFPSNAFIDKLVRTLLQTGSAVIRLNWDYKAINKYQAKRTKRKVKEPLNTKNISKVKKGEDFVEGEVEVNEVEKKVKYHINEPAANVLQHEEVYIAPNSGGEISEADFIIQEYITNLSALKENGGYANLDEIEYSGQFLSSNTSLETVPNQRQINYTDIGNKQIKIKEYWGYFDIDGDNINEPILCTVANDTTVIKLELNPFPEGKLPFEMVTISKDLYSLYGESDAEYLSVIQKIQTAIWRGGLDNAKKANMSQRGIPIGMFSNSKERSNYEAGRDYLYNPRNGNANAIINETFNELPGTFYNLTDKLSQEAEFLTGVSPQANHSSGSGSMSQPNSTMTSVQLRQLDIVRAIAMDGLLPMFRRWILHASEWMSPKEWGRIVGEENVAEIPDDISLFDLVDVEMEITTYELNKQKMDSLAFLFQTVTPGLPPEVQNMQIAKIFDIANFPVEADFMRNYKPEPDPMQEEAQKMEIEKMKIELTNLQKDGLYIDSKTKENYADVAKKMGDAEVKKSSAKVNEVKFLSELRNLPRQERSMKHMADLASKERINEQKLRAKVYEIDSRAKTEDKKLLFRNKDVQRKVLDDRRFKQDRLEFDYFKTDSVNKVKLGTISKKGTN